MKLKNKTPYPDTDVFGNEPEKAADLSHKKNKKDKKPMANFWYLVISVAVIAAIAAACVMARNLNMSYTTVSISFSEISAGCNPDGSPFDIYEVLSDEVLQKACEKLDNRMSPETLKEHISVTGITTDGSFNAIRQNVLDGNDTYSYFPTKYTVSYSVVSDSIKASGKTAPLKAVIAQLSLPSKTEILTAVTESYKEYYEDKYVYTSALLHADWTKLKSLDYFNRAQEFTNIINRTNRYLASRYDEDVKFASKDGVSFGDLSAELSLIADNDVESYRAFVIQNGITFDRDKILKQFRYVAKEDYEQVQRSRGEYDIMLEGISIYDPLVTKVVFIPSLDSDDDFYMNRTKIGIDYLIENANKADLSANESENEAQYYDYLIERFSSDEGSSEQLKESADKQCDTIMAKIDDFMERASAVNDEYIDTVSYEKLTVSGIGHGQGIVSSAVVVIKATIIWSSVFYVLRLAYSLLKRKKEESGNANS